MKRLWARGLKFRVYKVFRVYRVLWYGVEGLGMQDLGLEFGFRVWGLRLLR